MSLFELSFDGQTGESAMGLSLTLDQCRTVAIEQEPLVCMAFAPSSYRAR